ncbi:MAG TPA: flagellar basal body rod protein FlgC [Thermodesulfobacteriota bacterium]|nr:flagellar basal body rod protein FlgC [Thermodesulfobacteriota bacterium]
MDSFAIFKVSASALEAQKGRMNTIASNMANINSTQTESGGPYRRKDVVFSTTSIDSKDPVPLQGVKVESVTESQEPLKKVYDPGHPDANKEGFVSLPNINIMEEMVNMMMASRAYEANVTTFNMSKNMFLKALELGRV